MAIWLEEDDAATARDSSGAGTIAGSSEEVVGCWKARAQPKTRMATSTRSRVSQPEGGAERQHRNRCTADRQADLHDHAAVVVVGGVARDQHQRHQRQELRKPD